MNKASSNSLILVRLFLLIDRLINKYKTDQWTRRAQTRWFWYVSFYGLINWSISTKLINEQGELKLADFGTSLSMDWSIDQ